MTVYLSEHIAPSAYKRLASHFTIVDNFDHPEDLDAIIVRRAHVTGDVIDRAKKLKIISMHGVGLDTIDVEAAQSHGVPVMNVPGGSAESVAELAVTYLMALSRKLLPIDRGLREGRYHHFGETSLIGTELYGKKLGLVGAGHIAGRVAEIMRGAFSCDGGSHILSVRASDKWRHSGRAGSGGGYLPGLGGRYALRPTAGDASTGGCASFRRGPDLAKRRTFERPGRKIHRIH